VVFATALLWKRLRAQERLLIFCASFGIMMEVALASNDALSLRSGELFGLFDVASAVMIIPYLRRQAAVGYILFLLSLGGVFYRSSTKIIRPYASSLTQGQ